MRGRQMIFRKVYRRSQCKSLLKVLGILLLLCMLALCLCACTETAPPEATFTVQYLAGVEGRIEGNANQTVSAGEDAVSVTAVPNTGWVFVKWSDGVTEATRTDKGVSADISITALFEKIAYNIEYAAGEHGKIEGELLQSITYLEYGTTVKAIPEEGYRFAKWSDGGTNPERKDIVTRDIIITAEFVKTYVVQYEADGYGRIEGGIKQTVDSGADTNQVTAIPNAGYRFVKWSDGDSNATRSEKSVNHDITVTAIFMRTQILTVKYSINAFQFNTNDWPIGKVYQVENNEDGSIFEVLMGEDAPTVVAKPENKKFVFIKWSDGVMVPERQDLYITADLEVTALFGVIATYKVDGDKGGKIIGETIQTALPQEQLKTVVAVPDEGYVFSGWSDLRLNRERQDVCNNSANKMKNEYIAYFEPIEKMFRYNYGIANGKPMETSVVLNRNKIKETAFVVPQLVGYTFKGWYADSVYKLKVVNENGIYMLGYHGLTLETDTLYARWENDDEGERCVHKILFVMVDSVQAKLYSYKAQQDIEIDYKMSSIERSLCALLPEEMTETLNKWFKGIATFEIDSYYTVDSVHEESFQRSRSSTGAIEYFITAENVPEGFGLLKEYHNILTVFGLNDYDCLLQGAESGLASIKYGSIFLDSDINAVMNVWHYPLQDYYAWIKNGERVQDLLGTCIHEFTHTVECTFGYNEIYEYHEALKKVSNDSETTKKYLLGQLEIDGQMVGVPITYWKHEVEVLVSYMMQSEGGGSHGNIIRLDGIPTNKRYVYTNVSYGSDFSVEAVPDEGYKFVAWSDGVTTAIRTDKNIISFLSAKAIFEKK